MENTTQDWLFINPETYVDDEVNRVLQDILTEYSRFLGLDINLSSLAYSEKEKVKVFFEKIIDQDVYDSKDYRNIRKLLIDWYSTHRTEITKAKKSTDLNLLTNEELNEFMLSYGFPYPRNIVSRSNRIQFLSNLINNYRKKGTPETIANIISLYGLRNILISEWWIRYDSRRDKEFFAKSNVVYPPEKRNDRSLELEKSYNEFILNNPQWQLSYDELESLFHSGRLSSKYYDESTGLDKYNKSLRPTNKISLPSITNVISVEARSNLVDMEIACALFERKIQETLNFWVMYSLIPLKVKGLADSTIVTSMYNDPPTVDEMNEDLPHSIIETGQSAYDGNNNVYLVGPNPTGVWEDQGFERKLVKYNSDTTSWSLLDLSTFSKWSVFLREDSVSNANDVLVYNFSTSKWDIYSNFQKDVCFKAITHLYTLNNPYSTSNIFTMVYNGTEWVNLKSYIPTERILNRNENIYRDIPLNNYTGLYSLLEVQLAFCYLHNGTYNRPNNTPIVYSNFNYTGDYIPLDRGYTEIFKSDNSNLPLRNDIDEFYYSDSAYEPIKKEYRNLVFDEDNIKSTNNKITSFRHLPIDHDYYTLSPYDMQKQRKQLYYSKFTKQIYNEQNEYSLYNNMQGDYGIRAQMYPEEYLKAINPTFLDEINTQIASESNLLILENMMVDFEDYVINTLNIIDQSFAYIQTGGEFYNQKLLPVIHFFKPFRVRLLEFLTKFDIYNPLLDGILIGENISDFNIQQQFIEKPFPRNISTTDPLDLESPDNTISTMYIPYDQRNQYDSNGDLISVPPVLDYVLGHGLATEDYYTIQIEHIVNEPNFSPLDMDFNYNSLDISMTDAFFISVDEGGTEIYYYRTDDGVTVMDDNTLSPADSDDLEDEVNPI